MKFSVDKDVLVEAISWTARSLPNRPPSPVLAGVRITASENGEIEFVSYDYEVSAASKFPAEIEETGSILVSGKLLADISRALPNKQVEFQLTGAKVEIVCGTSRFSLATMPVDEYPSIPRIPDLIGQVSTTELSHAVYQVSVAASKDDTLPLLTGIRMEIENEKISLLATDRYRLALKELTWQPANPNFEAVALIRSRTLNDVAKSLTASSDITIGLSESDLIGFDAVSRTATSTLIEGDYPQVRRLFPDETPIEAVVESQLILDAVKRVSLVVDRNTSIRLNFSQGQLVLEAGQGENAQASEAIEAILTGDDIAVAFNPQYLADGISAVDSKFVKFGFTDANKPVQFMGQDELASEAKTDYRYLLVPIRFNN